MSIETKAQSPRSSAAEPPRGAWHPRAWWASATAWERFRVVALAVAVVGAVVHQLSLYDWWIEDAAISFTFARHLAEGEGLVAWPGGERVEGYSNPLWVFLLALWELFGINGFISSKILGVLFGGASVVLTWAITREIRGDDDIVPVFAAAVLAANPVFAIWATSGLENSLFGFLLALGLWRALVEVRYGGWPWSALAFVGVAMTRPEGILYAALAGGWAMVFHLAAGRGVVPTLKWLATFFVPFGVYHAWRYSYFAWPLPNTYYAKIDTHDYRLLDFDAKGWRYLRDFAKETGHGWFLPLYLLPMAGLAKRWRAVLTALLLAAVGVVVLYPGPEVLRDLELWPAAPPPGSWSEAQARILVGVGAIAPLTALGRPGWQGRVLSWSLMAAGLYFAIHAGGDWMRGFRWVSLPAVPMAVLFALGMGAIGDLFTGWLQPGPDSGRVRRWLGPAMSKGWGLTSALATLALLVGVVVPDIVWSNWFWNKRVTTPEKIRKRVHYMRYVQRRLHLDRVVNLDVDMGGTMYWNRNQEIVDIAGLVDVPIAHHAYEIPFWREYVFEEKQPDFAHLHGGWERKSKSKRHPEYERDYFEVPPYPVGPRGLHHGNWIRRDLFITDRWDGPRVDFADDIVLEGFDTPIGEATAGKHLYLEVALSSGERDEDDDFRVVAFLHRDGQVRSWGVPPGYDWYFPHEWGPDEVVFGRYSLALPADLPPGPWDLGFVVLGGDGTVVAPDDLPEGAQTDDAVFAEGEVRWADQVAILSPEQGAEALAAARQQLRDDAAALRCEQAADGWEDVRLRRPRDFAWQERIRPEVSRTVARCWLDRAAQLEDRAAVVEALAEARWWDHWLPGLQEAVDPVADALYAEGLAARAEGDWETAYERFTDVLRIDATRSWARRHAEEARDHRLGLHPEAVAERREEQQRLRRERERRRKRLKQLRREDVQGGKP